MRLLPLASAILKNRAGNVPRPQWCTYLVSFRCNARCQMCDSWRMKPGAEMDAEQVDEVFAKVGRLDVVRLTGGEPLMRADLAALAAAIERRSRPGVLHVTTNGSRPEATVAFVRSHPRPATLRFMVSFDGLAAEHDRNRGAEVEFATALATLRHLVALRDSHGIAVSVNHTVINARSLTDHAELRAQMAALGVETHAVLAYADSAMYGAKLRGKRAEHLVVPSGYPLHPALPHDQALEFAREQLAAAATFDDPQLRVGKRYYARGLVARLEGQPQPTPKPRCVALRSHLRLLPDGGVPVCQFNTEQIGNLLRQPFDELWQGVLAAQSRRWVDACPGCWAECEVVPNALFGGDLFGPENWRGLVKRKPPINLWRSASRYLTQVRSAMTSR